jgi:hypothetical protein
MIERNEKASLLLESASNTREATYSQRRLRGIKPPMSGFLMIESKQHQSGYLQPTEVLLQAIAPHRLRGIKEPMSGCLMIEREEQEQACCWSQQATPERLPTTNIGFAASNSTT